MTLVLVLAWHGFACAQPEDGDPFAACETAFLADPDHWRGAGCFYDTGLTKGLELEAAARLRTLIETHPDKAWLYFNLGRIAFDRGEAEAVSAFQKAIALFAEKGDISGEVYSRLNLYKWYVSFEDIEAAEKQLNAVGQATQRSEDANLQAQYQIHQALHEIQIGKDFEAAYHALLKTAEFAFPDGPYSLKRDCLLWLGGVSLKLDRRDQARHYYQRLAGLAKEKGDQALEANAMLHQAMITVLAEEQLASSRTQALALTKDALAIAERVDRPDLEAETSRLLGQLTSNEQGLAYLQQAVSTAEKLGEPLIWAECLGSLAKATVAQNPDQALGYIDKAYDLIADSEQPWSMMIWLFNRMRVHYEALPAEQSLQQAFAALDYVESSQGNQFIESGKIGLFSVWSEMYYWLAGTLLKDEPLGARESVERAFGVMERMRARVLLEAIQHDTNAAASEALRTAGEDIAALNRRLFDAKLGREAREAVLQELRDREFDYQKLKSEMGVKAPGDRLKVAAFPSLTELESSLAGDQAILAFQIAETQNIFGEFGGGSWLLAITASGTMVYPMPDRQHLAPAIRTYLGLMANTDNQAIFKEVSANFYQRLLKPALDDLDPKIKRLILIPDGPLHRLPFGSLAQTPTSPPLIQDYQISRVPSSTVWWICRNRKPPGKANGGLVFADPHLPQTDAAPATDLATRSWTMVGSAGLEPLPLSREEGQKVAEHLGGQSRLFLGETASESQLKQMDLNPFQVLHFAAHAVVDETSPQRSAVVLAPGDAQQDGLLQPGEIETLALSGQMVVLSTCSSASGQIFRGEGAMSLARAFLKAGASVVVATLQPLRDDDANFFFDHFYRTLSQGSSVAHAIQTAQKESIAAGRPPSAWAPVVAICSDEVRLCNAGFHLTFTQGILAVLALFGILLLATSRRPKRHPLPSRPSGVSS